MSDAKVKAFDCVQLMRQVRDEIDEQVAGMSCDEMATWIRAQRHEEPRLPAIADRAARNAAAEPGPRTRR